MTQPIPEEFNDYPFRGPDFIVPGSPEAEVPPTSRLKILLEELVPQQPADSYSDEAVPESTLLYVDGNRKHTLNVIAGAGRWIVTETQPTGGNLLDGRPADTYWVMAESGTPFPLSQDRANPYITNVTIPEESPDEVAARLLETFSRASAEVPAPTRRGLGSVIKSLVRR